MKFLLIQLKNLFKMLAHLDAGNQHVVHAFFIHRIYIKIQKHMSDQIKTLICWRKRGDWWIIFTLPLANIFVILIHYYVIFLHYRTMKHAKYTLVILCRTGQEIMNRNDAYDLWFHFQFLNMNFSGVKAHQNFVLIFKKLKLLLFLLFSSFMHILCDG